MKSCFWEFDKNKWPILVLVLINRENVSWSCFIFVLSDLRYICLLFADVSDYMKVEAIYF